MLFLLMIVLLPFVESAGVGNIVACNDGNFDCITDNTSNQKVCDVGGSLDFLQIGVANTSIPWPAQSTQYFTWTQGLTDQSQPYGIGQKAIGSRFLFGVPAEAVANNFHGCALFFNETVTGILENDAGSPDCSTYMGSQCPIDLIAQAQEFTKNLTTVPVDCEALAIHMVNSPPKSCSFALNGTWGALPTSSLNSSKQAVNQSQCLLTTYKNYTVYDVAEFFYPVTPKLIRNMMPIMTFLWSEDVPQISSDLMCLGVKYDSKLSLPASISSARISRTLLWWAPFIGFAGVLMITL